MIKEYAEQITAEYNKWHNQYEEASESETGSMFDQSFAAFMCNAISSAVSESSHDEVRRYFQEHAGE